MGTRCRPGSGSYALRAILPPYILDNIARNGSDRQRDEALNTQTVDNTFRSLRLAAQFAQPAVRGSALTATA